MDSYHDRHAGSHEAGFSLVELAVVIVIIGILVALAIPMIVGMQDVAKPATVEAAASNGASMVVQAVALEAPITRNDLTVLKSSTVTSIDFTKPQYLTELDLSHFCVTAKSGDAITASSGPACD